MKIMQETKSKIKAAKFRTKQTKVKLPQYKRGFKPVQGKKKSFLKSSLMNSSPGEAVNVQNSIDNEQLAARCSSKQNKKKIYSTAKGSNNKAQNSMDLSLKSSDDSTGTRLARDRDDKKYQDVLKQQRNISSPVIVEALSENLSSLRIPEVLRHNQKSNAKIVTLAHKPLRRQDVDTQKDEACIVIAESVNPNDTSRDQENDTPIASSSKSNRKQRKARKSLQSTDTAVPTWDIDEPTPTYEDCLENLKLDTTNKDSSALQTETASSNRKSMDNVQDVQTSVRFYCLKNKVIVIMSKEARFCFTGKLIVKVLYGAIEAYGYVITTETEPTEMYSPRGYSSISILTSSRYLSDSKSYIWTCIENEGISRDAKNKLVADIDQIEQGTAVVMLSNLENKLTKFLNVFYPFRLFPNIRNLSYLSWINPKRAEAILQSKLHIGNYTCKELIVDQHVSQDVCEKMLNRWRAKEWCCTLIAGGKSVGKSTTMRYLINSLLPVSKMVALVDVDPGQTECTPSECISVSIIEQPLMGPNFTHLKTPVFQLFIGDANVARCITRYIEGIKMLVDKLCGCPILSRLPIVVNTMGFTQGIGWNIIVFTIKLIRPSMVVQITSEKSKNNYAMYLNKEVLNEQELAWTSWGTSTIDWNRPCDHELCVVRSHAERKSAPANDTWNMEPYQQRELVMISYLSEIVKNPSSFKPYYDFVSLSINEAVPYVTSFSSLTISILRASIPPSHVMHVMNGNIVALCGIDVDADKSQETVFTSGPRVLNRPPLCSCYGFGIVRGIDTERKEVFINTPLPPSMMQHVNCLVGCIPIPTTLLQLNQHKNVPYTGGNGDLPMSREPRRGYFRMRYEKVQNKG